MFNFWKKFDTSHHQTKEGWYLCTVEVKNQQRYVMNLFWYNNKYSAYGGYFKDNLRQHIFDVYEVYGYDDNSPDKKKLLNTCDLCNRTDDVVYYKKIQKACMKGFVKDELR